MILGYVIVLFLIIKAGLQMSRPNDDYYIAAVVEYKLHDNLEENLASYLKDIKKAAKLGADIIVMPEYTLMLSKRYIAVPIYGILIEYPVPALYPDLYDEFLVEISSAARNNNIYIVINIAEELDCITNNGNEYCPEERIYYFNTNIVFNREGKVIDRYRKIHLFDEENNVPALVPQLGIFETDFGVKFGHFICFDILSQTPGIEIVEKYNLTDIAVPNMWYSELPFLTAKQVYYEYAYSMNVNFLVASGLHEKRGGGIGNAAIYSGKAGRISTHDKYLGLYVAKVPKIPGKVKKKNLDDSRASPYEFDDIELLSDYSLIYHVTRELQDGYQDFSLNMDDITCYFNITMRRAIGDTPYEYRAGAYSGVRSIYGFETHGIRDCAIFACLNHSIHSCGKRYPKYIPNSAAYFKSLTIEAQVPEAITDEETQLRDSTFGPTTVTLAIEPLKSQDFRYSAQTDKDTATHTMHLVNRGVELLGFGLKGRNFKKDGEFVNDY